jgi:hypothetical protein
MSQKARQDTRLHAALDAVEAQARRDKNTLCEMLAAAHHEIQDLRSVVNLPKEPRTSIGKATVTDPIVYRVIRDGGTLQDIICALVDDRKRLVDELCTLSTLAPRKVRLTDGTVVIYRAPDDLVPDAEPAPEPVAQAPAEVTS